MSEPPTNPTTAERAEAQASAGASEPAELGVSLADVLAARERIAPYVFATPIFGSQTLSRMTNTDLGLKAENLQKTGSFKLRGAINAVLQLTPEQRGRGVVTMSAGNHGQALALAASLAGVRCVVFLPESAVKAKVEAIRGYGAEVRFAPTMETLRETMEAYRDAHGVYYVPPFADPAIVAGQGTVGLEILEDRPDVEAIVVCVGGGGLLSGIALAVKEQRPEVRVVGVEPEGADVVHRSLEAGRPLVMDKVQTVADGLAAPFAAPLTQAIVERYADDVVLVTDDEILQAMRLILERAKLLVEPAGAAAVAALLTNKAGLAHGTRTVATLSGGNIDIERLKGLL
jgi:threonine dehydratase